MTEGQKKLEKLLNFVGMGIPTLSNRIGVNRQRFYDIKSGKTSDFSFDLAEKICAVFPNIKVKWLIGDSEEFLQNSYMEDTNLKGNPFFTNFTAQGGYAHGNGQESALVPDGFMTVPGINPSMDIPFIMARGKSMVNKEDPTHSITPGSWVAVKRVVGGAIRWGEVYAMETVDGPIIKKLLPSDREDCIKCVSFNEDFPPFDLPTADIVDGALYLVKGVVNVQVWN